MRIVFSNFDDLKNPYYGGGGALAIHNVAKRLALKHQVTVLTGKYPKCENEIVDNVFYQRIGFSLFSPQISQLIFQFCLPYYVLVTKFDVWLESFTPPFSTAFLPLFTKKPVIGLTHLLSGELMWKKYKIPFYLIENLGLKFYKQIIVLNDYLKFKVSSVNRNIIASVIPNGIESSLISNIFTKDGKFILFLGRIDYTQKGLDLLLESYKKIVDKTLLDLVIAGSGSIRDENKLNEHIEKLGLSKRVHLKGRVHGGVKDDLYKEAKIFVMSSRDEAMPLTLLECFSYKCALVYFRINVLTWIPLDIAIGVTPYDTDAFADAIMQLSNNDQRCTQLGNNAKVFVKQFDWDAITLKYENFITETVNKSISN